MTEVRADNSTCSVPTTAGEADPGRLVLDGTSLEIDQVVAVANRSGTRVDLDESAVDRVRESWLMKFRLIETGMAIYGVTTGFGDSVVRQVSPEKTTELQHNLIRYHLNGTGPSAPPEVVRATLLIRANCLSRGYSAVNPAIILALTDLLANDVLPVIPQRGSVGASGDLVPLCYVASALIGEGTVRYAGQLRPSAEVLAALGLTPVTLHAKDGLALINGTSFSAAYSALTVAAAQRLAVLADICTALATEALLGNRGAFHRFIHLQKPHPGQLASAGLIAELLAGSHLALDHDQVVAMNPPHAEGGYRQLSRSIQDRYSIRCAPHVTGVLRDTLTFASAWVRTEINSTNDNPLFDTESGSARSGGNFYGGHLVQAMDSLKAAVANIADLLDRQVALLVDEKFNNGLTPNLIEPVEPGDWAAGLHHGFKGMQIACSAITAEALKTTMPASVFSRSTEAHNQDKVSMAPLAARDAWAVTQLVEEVAAIHLLAACQALDLRGAERMSPRTRAVHDLVRREVPRQPADRRMDSDIAAVLRLIRSGELVDSVAE
ncbi:histidine ammonia-lyase (EC 4.3.1.3) [Goodfellowiella coeruleoviolacea]|uniref:Histidine ammonia-lyase n=1 Tax=Goodfellowiella coeruleoviolacea TaxID=334858 RepID=A0AAE3GQG6_9PSEU|nr:histidine ammonia-lyase (EC 4.3.1.3) [Goodfellowiella coeruleoviolacea]